MTPSPERTPLPSDPHWYKNAIIYEVRVRSFYDSNGDGIGDLVGLTEKLDYLQDLGVTAIWMLPLCPSPGRDDGYDIADYTDVHPDVGTLADFQLLLAEAHRRGIRVITEIVINHTSDQHPWFQRARRAPQNSPERAFYVWSDTPDRYRDARIIFKDFETSNWSWDPIAKSYFWHRFYAHQPDLNFENIAVHDAVFEVVDFWLDMGVDGIRLDAVPYLYEEEGTNCENLPKTHAFLKKLRAHMDAKYVDRMILAEANQWPEDAAAYFGDGDECHMNFHFPIMPRMFMAIRMEDRLPIIDILAQTPALPRGGQWALFLRNHDELTLEMVTDEERDYMYRAYASDPAARINLGIRRRLAPLVANGRREMELLNGLLFSLPGTPVLYYGDEIGMGDNVYLGDRNGVRTPMQWSADRNAGFSRANPQRLILPIVIDPEYHYESLNVEAQQNNPNSLLWWMKRVIALRKGFQAFGEGSIEFLNPSNPRVIAFVRRHGDEVLLIVANLSRFPQFVELDLSAFKGLFLLELFGKTAFPAITDRPYLLTLDGHAFHWFALRSGAGAEDQAQAAAYAPPELETSEAWQRLIDGGMPLALQKALPRWLYARRWFEPRGAPKDATIVETYALPRAPVVVAVISVTYAHGEPDRYLLPIAFVAEDRAAELRDRAPHAVIANVRLVGAGDALTGVLVDAVADPSAAAGLVQMIADGERIRGEHELRGQPTPELGRLLVDAPPTSRASAAPPQEARVLRLEHTNASLVFRDQVFLKLARRIDHGVGPDLEMGRFLTSHARPGVVPAVLGSLDLAGRRGEPATLGILQAYVRNDGTAFRHALGELGRFYEQVLTTRRDEAPPELPETSVARLAIGAALPEPATAAMGTYRDAAVALGQLVGDMHLALVSDPSDPLFGPEPHSTLDQRSVYQSMRNLVGRVVRRLRADLLRFDGEERGSPTSSPRAKTSCSVASTSSSRDGSTASEHGSTATCTSTRSSSTGATSPSSTSRATAKRASRSGAASALRFATSPG